MPRSGPFCLLCVTGAGEVWMEAAEPIIHPVVWEPLARPRPALEPPEMAVEAGCGPCQSQERSFPHPGQQLILKWVDRMVPGDTEAWTSKLHCDFWGPHCHLCPWKAQHNVDAFSAPVRTEHSWLSSRCSQAPSGGSW